MRDPAQNQSLKVVPLPVSGLGLRSGRELLSRDIAPREYVVSGWIPTGLTIVAGRAKVGKSSLMRQVVEAVVHGREVLGHRCLRGEVIYLTWEDDETELKERLADLEPGTLDGFHFLLSGGLPLDAEMLGQLRKDLNDRPAVRLVVVDSYFFAKPTGASGASVVDVERDFYAPLKQLADQARVAVVVLHHMNQRGTIAGTYAVTGTADSIVRVERPERLEKGLIKVDGRRVPRSSTDAYWHELKRRWATQPSKAVVAPTTAPEEGQHAAARGGNSTKKRVEVRYAMAALGGKATPREVADHLGEGTPRGVDRVRKLMANMESSKPKELRRRGRRFLLP